MGLWRNSIGGCVVALALLATTAAAQPRPAQPPSQLFPEAQPPAPVGPPVIYTMEQIVVPALTPELQQALRPVHSLQQAEEILKVRGQTFGWRRVDVASTSMPPQMASQLAALPPHEVFVVNETKGAVIGAIVQQRPAPAGGPPAPPPSH